MWHTGSDGEDGPDEEFLRRMGPPDNEVPVALPWSTVLARTGDVAVALLGIQVYSTGLAVSLAVRVRDRLSPSSALSELVFGREGSGLLLGVGFADGRRVASGGVPRNDPGLVWQPGSGSGGNRSVDQTWWLSPLPPAGPLTFVVRCAELGIEETATEVDGAAVRAAAAGVVELWPWAPPSPWEEEPPRPPDLPPGSWFAGP
ncbi:hypothetical protein SAMN05660657_03922 [Geodermatophilus amargosae]|uniref:Uncharacterized protein n=1 Tax=Geodermatophilus amargosae TaxID=1296565 RepID=A0A1I7BYA0_9ACTN|nr:hypothetical protein [Geodermatophilus amargosae]SFT92176.1 hypothetical protein SAMN05660657_03922 [Geodermatophilus amargosae]